MLVSRLLLLMTLETNLSSVALQIMLTVLLKEGFFMNVFLCFVQFYLHQHDEIPKMKETGFAVPPSLHTLVAVDRSEVIVVNNQKADSVLLISFSQSSLIHLRNKKNNLTQVKNLPQPYGDCVIGAIPVSNCLMKCEAETLMELCGCLDLYMSQGAQGQLFVLF